MLKSVGYWFKNVHRSRLHSLSTRHTSSLLASPRRDWQVEGVDGGEVGGALAGQASGGRSGLHCERSMGMEVGGMMVVLPIRS